MAESNTTGLLYDIKGGLPRLKEAFYMSGKMSSRTQYKSSWSQFKHSRLP